MTLRQVVGCGEAAGRPRKTIIPCKFDRVGGLSQRRADQQCFKLLLLTGSEIMPVKTREGKYCRKDPRLVGPQPDGVLQRPGKLGTRRIVARPETGPPDGRAEVKGPGCRKVVKNLERGPVTAVQGHFPAAFQPQCSRVGQQQRKLQRLLYAPRRDPRGFRHPAVEGPGGERQAGLLQGQQQAEDAQQAGSQGPGRAPRQVSPDDRFP